ncbi:unnamed protein product [Adineta ricciae]|uniref:Apple domain-containing protein n=1 Tax=Adineta ricciae TaxID=249248 RepID=A0A815WUL4_ADIRI|nr:unnamed protein product [Adineta ricciae]CAF1546330.1 unnamed protein product [Adineta ricciae]
MPNDIRSIQMLIANDKIFQCAQSTCLPFYNFVTSDIRRCQINCLNQDECVAATFYQSNLQCQLFNTSIKQNTNMSFEMNAVTMITVFRTRYPYDLITFSATSTSSTSSSSTSSSTSTAAPSS